MTICILLSVEFALRLRVCLGYCIFAKYGGNFSQHVGHKQNLEELSCDAKNVNIIKIRLGNIIFIHILCNKLLGVQRVK